MNPEFERNLWLELTQRRVIQMIVVLALIFLTVNLAGAPQGLWLSAQFLFYGIVVVWGTREAAQSVVGEIRERTWDLQRLSALTPFEMIWGKLLGATSYVWLGGLICLAVLLATEISFGWTAVAADLFYYIAIGLAAQATALFASLVAIRRRQTHTRFNVFQYQSAGVLAAWVVWSTGQTIAPNGLVRIDMVEWWGATIGAREFFLVSLAVFLFWVLVGCYRLMRLELQVQSRPTVWTAFLVFMAVYVAGFDRVPAQELVSFDDRFGTRLGLACATLAVLTYLAVLFEPKDRVLYRWLDEMVAKRRWMAVASRLQCWMISYAATMIVGMALALRLNMIEPAEPLLGAMVLAGLGFVTRDLGIFLYFGLAPGQKRGDMPALVTLGVLYALGPQLLSGLGTTEQNLLLFPMREAGWIGIAAAWAEAILIWLAVLVRRRQSVALHARPSPSAGP